MKNEQTPNGASADVTKMQKTHEDGETDVVGRNGSANFRNARQNDVSHHKHSAGAANYSSFSSSYS